MFFVLALAAACATASGPQPVNVATVRHQIDDAIQAQNGDRTIHSMGKVSQERAVVFTTSKAGSKQEETWVKDPVGAWRLENSTALSGAPKTDAN